MQVRDYFVSQLYFSNIFSIVEDQGGWKGSGVFEVGFDCGIG